MIGWGAGIEAGDDSQLIVFISGYLYPNYPEFHFKAFSERFSQTKLFLRDNTGHQFRTGIPEVTETEQENVEFLRYIIRRVGARRVTFVSGSVGSHPAILWGHRIGVDDIHLVGPVTDYPSLLRTDRAAHPQFAQLIGEVTKQVEAGYEYADLRAFMAANPDKVGSVDIYYSATDPIDNDQALNIADLPQVRSTVYFTGDHFRVPVFVLRRDPDMTERINAPRIERPADLRRLARTAPRDLGYASVRLD